MPKKQEKAVEVYKKLVGLPSLIEARLLSCGTIIQSKWVQRDLDAGRPTKFQHLFTLSPELEKLQSTFPTDISNEILSTVSSSELLQAIVRNRDGKQFLEIWNSNNLQRSVDLAKLNLHGDIYAEMEFVTFEWSPDETKLLYVAEKNATTSEAFYVRKPSSSGDSKVKKGEEYEYKEDWGDCRENKVQSVLVEYDIVSDSARVLEGIPQDLCVGTSQYSPDGSYIIGICYYTKPRKYAGQIGGYSPSVLFKLDFVGNFEEIAANTHSVKSPRFTPDGDNIIWFRAEAGSSPGTCYEVVKTTAPPSEESEIETVLEVVHTEVETTNGTPFYGLTNPFVLKRCWCSDGRLIFSDFCKNLIKLYVLDIESGEVTELPNDSGSQEVLDIFDDIVVILRSNFFKPDTLAIGRLPEKGEEASIEWVELTETKQLEEFEGLNWHYMDLTASNTSEDVRDFNTIYVGPETGEDKEVPVVVYPHGGPCMADVNKFNLTVAFFTAMGYAVILVNYRGSVGMGLNCIESLRGKIGKIDIADCVLATVQAFIQYPWIDSNRTSLMGISYGGFLSTLLSGQYPDMFKSVVAINAVTDFAWTSVSSDVPYYMYYIAGTDYSLTGEPDLETFTKLRKVSPIQYVHKVKAPTLIVVGKRDRRVPHAQALDYYHHLKANGVPTRVLMYEDHHIISGTLFEIDLLINGFLWIENHTSEDSDDEE